MRRLIAALLSVVATGCAQTGAPPGGPPDDNPPKLLRIRPDTNAVNVRAGAVTLQFDDVISERPQGASGLAGLFLISPSIGEPSVSWHRRTLQIRPRGGYRPNTTYTLTMLPGLTDLDGNVDSTGLELVFSTGSSIAQGRISGVQFDWPNGKVAPRSLVEAISLPDSLHYVTTADSLGEFVVGHLPNGKYLLRGILDQNRNRRLDPRELFDTSTVTLNGSLHGFLYAFVHDTLGPSISSVAVKDSLTLRVTFDHPLDTALVITPALFGIKRADSSSVTIVSAITQRAFDKLVADSLLAKHVKDSLEAVAKADSARRADGARVNAKIDRPAAKRPVPRDSARADTVPRREAQKIKIAVPSVDVLLTLTEPLPPNTVFRVRAVGMRSLLKRERTSDRLFRTAKPAPVDSSRKGADSTKKPPPDTSKVKRNPAGDGPNAFAHWLGALPNQR
ncbi:MAG: Ig-like domain-containing protein [Gemmatimonadaceae bacterium]